MRRSFSAVPLNANNGRLRFACRNDVLAALTFYLTHIERGDASYAEVFRDIVHTYLDKYPREVAAFLHRAERHIPDIAARPTSLRYAI